MSSADAARAPLSHPAGSVEARGRAVYGVALAYAVLLGAAVRLFFVLRSDFPPNDGGLFYAMVEDLRRSHYALPAFTSYNAHDGVAIPFAYAPLPFYLVGLLSDLTGWRVLDLFRFAPVAASVLTVPAFLLLARVALPSRAAVAFAVYAFALLPRSFEWQIMGGGVTRSLGLLFAVLAVHQVYLMYDRREVRRVPAAAALAACAALSHLEFAWFTACCAGVLFLARGRNRTGVVSSALVAAGTATATAPWWVTVVARHGLQPFLSATELGAAPYAGLVTLLLRPTDEASFSVLAVIAAVGVVACLADRRYLLPAWLVAMFLLDARKAQTTATVPLALLAGVGASDVLLPLLGRARPAGSAGRGRLAEAVLGFALFHAVFISALVGPLPLLTSLSPADRAALRWVAASTPASSQFVVVTGDQWAIDRVSEWFPVLAERPSVATVQGREWLPGFSARIQLFRDVQGCAARDAACLDAWARTSGETFTHVYVAKREGGSGAEDAAWSLRESLRADPRYRVEYDGPAATIFGPAAGR